MNGHDELFDQDEQGTAESTEQAADLNSRELCDHEQCDNSVSDSEMAPFDVSDAEVAVSDDGYLLDEESKAVDISDGMPRLLTFCPVDDGEPESDEESNSERRIAFGPQLTLILPEPDEAAVAASAERIAASISSEDTSDLSEASVGEFVMSEVEAAFAEAESSRNDESADDPDTVIAFAGGDWDAWSVNAAAEDETEVDDCAAEVEPAAACAMAAVESNQLDSIVTTKGTVDNKINNKPTRATAVREWGAHLRAKLPQNIGSGRLFELIERNRTVRLTADRIQSHFAQYQWRLFAGTATATAVLGSALILVVRRVFT